jgi:ribonuclease T2
MAALAARRDVTVADLRRALTAANPRIPGPAFAIITNRRGWLDEVRICLNRRYRAEACPTFSRGANDSSALRIAAPD